MPDRLWTARNHALFMIRSFTLVTREESIEVLTLLIAVVALVIAVMAFQKAGGGIQDLRKQLDELSKKSEQATRGARETAADVLNCLESLIRGQSKTSPEQGPQSKSEGQSESQGEHKP
ncbi:MAG: hypothetical protein D6704_12235 [Nitrospirae bacterium]|nr:MAG: hypothetical protein D6704_12235 [Nitrospirota bacterium]